MAKKNETQIIRPSVAIDSLRDFNTCVLALANIVLAAIENNLIDDSVKPLIEDSLNDVTKFYKD